VALELLKSYLVTVLDPVAGLGVRVVSEWTRYPPFPGYDPAESFEWLVDSILFSPLVLEMNFDGLQLFADAPTLRVPTRVAQGTETARHTLSLVLGQSQRLFSRLVRTGMSDQVQLAGFRHDPTGLEDCVPREKLLLDVLHRWLIGAHASSARGGASYTCIVLQMRLALDRLATRKRAQTARATLVHEAPGTAELRTRQMPKLQMLANLLRSPSLYDSSRASYLALRDSGRQRLIQEERRVRAPAPVPPRLGAGSRTLALPGPPAQHLAWQLSAPRPSAYAVTPRPAGRPLCLPAGVDPLRRLREMTQVLRAVKDTGGPRQLFG